MEKDARGLPPQERVQLRQSRSKPLLDDLQAWLAARLARIPGKSEPAKAIRYALTRMEKLRPYLGLKWSQKTGRSAKVYPNRLLK